MGSMDVPPVLSKHLNTWLPLILVVECLITALNLWDKIMGMWVTRGARMTDGPTRGSGTQGGMHLLPQHTAPG